MYTPVNPSFTILKWGLRGSTLYRHVFLLGKRILLCYNRHLFREGIILTVGATKCVSIPLGRSSIPSEAWWIVMQPPWSALAVLASAILVDLCQSDYNKDILSSWMSGPSCSKLTTSLVNVSLKFWSLNMVYMLIILLKKNVSSFCIWKSYSHFPAKISCELDIVLTRTGNILTTNEHVKVTMLRTTGPRTS